VSDFTDIRKPLYDNKQEEEESYKDIWHPTTGQHLQRYPRPSVYLRSHWRSRWKGL